MNGGSLWAANCWLIRVQWFIIIMLVIVGQCIMFGLTFKEEVPESSVSWKRCWEEYDSD